jgi:3-oxoadipate CoA-transferase beta subunit
VSVQGQLSPGAMAALVARDIPDGSTVNLGIGLPTIVADHLRPESQVVLHTENGMLDMGPRAVLGAEDPDLTNAGKQPVSELPGSSYFDSATSFAMMRGGHLDICVMGAFQVAGNGDLANWHTDAPDAVPAVGGAMDLAIGAKSVFVTMTLFTKDGRPKLVPACTYPLTGIGCVDRVYTDFAIFDLVGGQVVVRATFGSSFDELAKRLDLPLRRYSCDTGVIPVASGSSHHR